MFQFQEFETEKSFDIVQILVGGRTEDKSVNLATLSGKQELSNKLFVSASNFMIVKFSTDSSVEKKGFRASWKTEAQKCGGNLQATPQGQVLASPGYPHNYPGGLECLYIIRAQPGRIISLEVIEAAVSSTIRPLRLYIYIFPPRGPMLAEFQTEEVETPPPPSSRLNRAASCFQIEHLDLEANRDYILIRDGDSPMSPKIVHLTGKLDDDGENSTTVIMSTGSDLYLYFKTSLGDSRRGFSIRYTQGCRATIVARNGTVQSPSFNLNNYPNNQECLYTIRNSIRGSLSLKFVSFDVHQTDYVQVRKHLSLPLCGGTNDARFIRCSRRFTLDHSTRVSRYTTAQTATALACIPATVSLGTFNPKLRSPPRAARCSLDS